MAHSTGSGQESVALHLFRLFLKLRSYGGLFADLLRMDNFFITVNQ
jgi:hypothetical protein